MPCCTRGVLNEYVGMAGNRVTCGIYWNLNLEGSKAGTPVPDASWDQAGYVYVRKWAEVRGGGLDWRAHSPIQQSPDACPSAPAEHSRGGMLEDAMWPGYLIFQKKLES